MSETTMLTLPPGMRWKTDHHGGWEVRDHHGNDVGCVVRVDGQTWTVWRVVAEKKHEDDARGALARLFLTESLLGTVSAGQARADRRAAEILADCSRRELLEERKRAEAAVELLEAACRDREEARAELAEADRQCGSLGAALNERTAARKERDEVRAELARVQLEAATIAQLLEDTKRILATAQRERDEARDALRALAIAAVQKGIADAIDCKVEGDVLENRFTVTIKGDPIHWVTTTIRVPPDIGEPCCGAGGGGGVGGWGGVAEGGNGGTGAGSEGLIGGGGGEGRPRSPGA